MIIPIRKRKSSITFLDTQFAIESFSHLHKDAKRHQKRMVPSLSHPSNFENQTKSSQGGGGKGWKCSYMPRFFIAQRLYYGIKLLTKILALFEKIQKYPEKIDFSLCTRSIDSCLNSRACRYVHSYV